MAPNENFALGDERFGKAIAHALRAQVTPGMTGRPRKQVEGDVGDVD